MSEEGKGESEGKDLGQRSSKPHENRGCGFRVVHVHEDGAALFSPIFDGETGNAPELAFVVRGDIQSDGVNSYPEVVIIADGAALFFHDPRRARRIVLLPRKPRVYRET